MITFIYNIKQWQWTELGTGVGATMRMSISQCLQSLTALFSHSNALIWKYAVLQPCRVFDILPNRQLTLLRPWAVSEGFGLSSDMFSYVICYVFLCVLGGEYMFLSGSNVLLFRKIEKNQDKLEYICFASTVAYCMFFCMFPVCFWYVFCIHICFYIWNKWK